MGVDVIELVCQRGVKEPTGDVAELTMLSIY